MKRFFLSFGIVLTCFSLLAAPAAEAKRFGGGGSIGKQRSISPQQMQKSPSAAPAPAAPPTAAPQSTGNKWLGPLAGLAIGAGLGALFAGGGLGGAMSGILTALAVAAVIMLLISLFRRKPIAAAAPMQYAGAGAPYGGAAEPVQPVATGASAPVAANIPADFPVDAFLRSAKTSFIRLQAANDRKDLNDIREYTTPEMFAEISMQLSVRDNSLQKTDVVSINADLLEVAHEGEIAIASVRMTGQLRENDGASESFDEVWHVQKNLKDEKAVWLLSGIQQIA